LSNGKKKAAPRIASRFVSLPSKHIAFFKDAEGKISFEPASTAYTARSMASDVREDCSELNSAILMKQIGALAFEPAKK
jgi:hypothetical protein